MKGRIHLIYHLAVWVAYISITIFFYLNRFELALAIYKSFYLIIPQIIIVYTNTEILIPRFFVSKQYGKYLFWSIASLGLLYLYFHITNHYQPFENGQLGGFGNLSIRPFSFEMEEHIRHKQSFIRTFNMIESMAVILLAVSLKTSQVARTREKETIELRNEKLQGELRFLKSQINPHFLFNALNNIYTLSLLKSEKAPDTLLRLSEMLRYIIYDCNNDLVPIEKEAKYIQHYINLIKLKDENIINIRQKITIDDPSRSIAPMLLIPFLENAFKHSKIEDTSKGWIDIDLELKENKLTYFINNSLPEELTIKDKTGGIGIENVKKRLNFVYPENHELKIEIDKDKYSVTLTLLL